MNILRHRFSVAPMMEWTEVRQYPELRCYSLGYASVVRWTHVGELGGWTDMRSFAEETVRGKVREC